MDLTKFRYSPKGYLWAPDINVFNTETMTMTTQSVPPINLAEVVDQHGNPAGEALLAEWKRQTGGA